MYDGSKRFISRHKVNAMVDTETGLIADAKKGDTTIVLKNCKNWDKYKRLLKRGSGIVCFNAQKDFSDLPNSNYEMIKSAEKEEDHYLITLRRPLKKSIDAGTRVRLHIKSGGYMYCASAGKKLTKDWKKFSAEISGVAVKGVPNDKFWPGTKFVRLVVIANYGKTKGPKTFFTGIKFKELSSDK
ncbi:MAG: hypothetical protein GY718_19365 [Lentisphaerae bacterium]|nr:hypothetical protein [Lentisphaerota bacterium]